VSLLKLAAGCTQGYQPADFGFTYDNTRKIEGKAVNGQSYVYSYNEINQMQTDSENATMLAWNCSGTAQCS